MGIAYLPGAETGDLDDEARRPSCQVDPQLAYQPRYKLSEEHVFDSVHRLQEAKTGQANLRSQKRRLFDAFMHEHEQEYENARKPKSLQPALRGESAVANAANHVAALKRQQAFSEARLQEEMAITSK